MEMRRSGVGAKMGNRRQEVVNHHERVESLAEKYFSVLNPSRQQLSFFSHLSGDYLFLFLVALICQRHYLAVFQLFPGPSPVAFVSDAEIGNWDVAEIGYA